MKCFFDERKVEYLWHIIKPFKLEIDWMNTKSPLNAKPKTTKTQLRFFLGLGNVYPRFIHDFVALFYSPNVLLKRTARNKFKLDEEQLESFKKFMDCIISPLVIELSIPDLPYSGYWEASVYQVGCALLKTKPKHKENISFLVTFYELHRGKLLSFGTRLPRHGVGY